MRKQLIGGLAVATIVSLMPGVAAARSGRVSGHRRAGMEGTIVVE